MDRKRKHLLDLDDYCLLEIMKYIIADCELREEPPDHPLKYEYIENFAKAYEYIEGLLKSCFKSIYYRRELTLLAKLRCLSIDYGPLQSIIEKKMEKDAYWKLYTKAIRENTALQRFQLNYNPSSSYPDFPKHFQMLKSALANKTRLSIVKIDLKGYFLEDLPNLGYISELCLDVTMSAEDLASICKSNPDLYKLEFMSSEIQGRLSDIVPHCRRLQYLKFVPKPDVDGCEYAPLAELPRLKEITFHGAYKNGSLLTMFKAIQKWHAAGALSMNFSDELASLSTVTIARMNSLKKLRISSKKFPPRVELITNYDFSEISKDTGPLEQSLAVITLMAANLEMDLQGKIVTLWKCPTSDIDISEFVSILKLFHVESVHIENKVHYPGDQTPKAKLFASMIPDGLFNLKSIQINQGQLDKFATLELVKIKSVKLLKCSFSDWESIELLSELSDLTTLGISVEKKFENAFSKALCKLLNTCQESGVIDCKSWRIKFVKNKRSSVRTLNNVYVWKKESINELFEALSHGDLEAIEEVYLERNNFKDIANITAVQTIKKLNISLIDTVGIEQLSELNRLEELTLKHNIRGTLINLFDQLAKKESPRLQFLQLKSNALFPKELYSISRIKSLKKLELIGPFFSTESDALNELANSNIEELVIVKPQRSLRKLFAAFASKSTTRLQHIKIVKGTLDRLAFEELSKLKGLRSFTGSILNSENLPFLQKLENLESLNVQVFNVNIEFSWENLKKLVIHSPIEIEKCQCLPELENLESLSLSLLSYDVGHNNNASDALANIKNLKELHIESTTSQDRVYRSLASKDGLKLRHLTAAIGFVEELNNIMRIKSLRSLNLRLLSHFTTNSDLDQLEELQSLHVTKATYERRSENQLKTVLAILKSSRNLDSLSIILTHLWHAEFIREVHNLLTSIRDPALQGPLSLTIEEPYKYDQYKAIVHMAYIDDEYLKVYYINM